MKYSKVAKRFQKISEMFPEKDSERFQTYKVERFKPKRSKSYQVIGQQVLKEILLNQLITR